MMDRASWEFTDLRARMNALEGREELDANDILRPHVLGRIVTTAWLGAKLKLDDWRLLQPVLHDEFAGFAEEAYHDTNRWLLERNVLPETDLRPFIPAAHRVRRGLEWTAAASGKRVERRVLAGPRFDVGHPAPGERGFRRPTQSRCGSGPAGAATALPRRAAVVGRTPMPDPACTTRHG